MGVNSAVAVSNLSSGFTKPNFGDGYGTNFWTRFCNIPRAIWNGDYDTKDPNMIQLSLMDNPASLLIPFAQMPKALNSLKVLGRASKGTLVTSSFFRELGIRGFFRGKVITPFGYANSWDTLLGRWLPFVLDPHLIYDKLLYNNLTEDNSKKR